MAEAIVSTILKKLASITIEKASEAWRLVSGVEKDVQRLESNFKAIQYQLEDAEEKQYHDKSLKVWLEWFKQVSYDMEDVLDDWETAVHDLQTADHGVETSSSIPKRQKVCQLVSRFFVGSQIVRRHDIATRIKDINEELDRIVKDKDKFKLIKREIIKQPNWAESTCFVDVSKLHGRDSVKEEVIRTLLSGTCEEEGSCIPTIAIVGMGGIGKTALAQLIYHDPRIQSHFHKKIWVCVSNPFNLNQIARAILEDLEDRKPKSFLLNETRLQTLLGNIRKKINGKKFFLVLDDVRKENSQAWEQLKAIFQSGMLGSRILVTAPNQSVVAPMECSHVRKLKLLSEDTCWAIFSQVAFLGRNEMDRENLEDIGREIAKKCGGLPLVLKPLGSLLQDKSREEWQNVLNSDIWKLDGIKSIYTSFLLSYADLPSTIKLCLLYCAIFPKDHKLIKDELVQHWMAQGYLKPEDKFGEDPFRYLATSFFLQDFDKDEDGNIICCKMHDSLHSFARLLTDGSVTEMIVKDSELKVSSKSPRHLRLVIEKGSSSPMSIRGTEKLRSLIAVSHEFNQTTSEALQNLFSGSKHLRLLELHSFYLDAKAIARGIGNLIHLRYFSLIGCSGIKSLPEAVCELRNLQSLNLRSCQSLKKLPVGIGNLINLRFLCIEDCNSLTSYPKGISNLTSLMRLSYVRVRADRNDADEFSFGDLENLDLLGGNLRVQLTGNALDWNEAKRAKLHRKIHLKRMEILHHSQFLYERMVVRALNPPPHMSLEILYCDTDIPKWKMQLGKLLKNKVFGSGKNATD